MMRKYNLAQNISGAILSIIRSAGLGLLLTIGLFSQGDDLNFNRFSIIDGLSQNTANSILQDKQGFIWIGTQDGLNRFDGYDFKKYRNDPDNPLSLSNNHVQCLYFDSKGTLWVGTSGGLNRFDHETEHFYHYLHEQNKPLGLSNNYIQCICEDDSGALWIGTNGGGLNRFDRESGRFTHFIQERDNPLSLSGNEVYSLLEDSRGDLWVGTFGGGLDRWDPEIMGFIHFRNEPDNPHSLSHDFVKVIREDRMGTLWVGTDEGLNHFDRKSGRFTHFRYDPENPNSLSNDLVHSIFEDHQGRLWIGTEFGLNLFDRPHGHFVRYHHEPNNPRSLSADKIMSLYEDAEKNLWIGTLGHGISRLDSISQSFFSYRNDPYNDNGLCDNEVWSIYEDRRSDIWIGTRNGLNRWDAKSGNFQRYVNHPDNPYSLNQNHVWDILEDSKGRFWVGTNGGGLNRFDRDRNRFTSYRHRPNDPESLSHDSVQCIYEDRQGDIWLGTLVGLNHFDPDSKTFIRYLNDMNDSQSLSFNFVQTIFEDSSGFLWVGTLGGGLNRFDRSTRKFTRFQHNLEDPFSISDDRILFIREYPYKNEKALWIGTGSGLNIYEYNTEHFISYTEKDGLSNNVVYAALEDREGNIWISTNGGLSQFNPKTKTFKNYDVKDGLQSNEFNAGACFKSPSGRIYFGGVNGMTVFHPEEFRNNPYIPPVMITDFQIFNKSVPIEKNGSILRKTIMDTEEITLSHRDSVFSLEFTALNYIRPDKNEYKYIMENFDKDWNYVKNRRFASYTNLPPGKYVFRVKASNNDGIWNEAGASLKIRILPSFWQTWWFRLMGLSLILFSIVTVQQIRHRSILERNRKLEKRVAERTAELSKANQGLNDSLVEKEVLLKEIHHRVKNNMQIVSSMLRLQSGYIQDDQAREMFKESQNRVRSMALIHEKLYQSKDLAKIDFGEYILHLTDYLFHSYGIESDSIQLKMDIQDISMDIYHAIPCSLILNELLSNSLKYAFPDKKAGKILIRMRQDQDNKIKLTVADNGVGFPKDVDFKNTESLGLRLVNALVSQLKATIDLKHGEGTRFSIEFEKPEPSPSSRSL